MGKKKKKHELSNYEMDARFDDPASIDAFVRGLVMEGEFGPANINNNPQIPPVISPPIMPQPTPQPVQQPKLHTTQRAQQSGVRMQQASIPKQPKTTRNEQKAQSIQMANYGRLRFDLITNAYGPALLFSDAFGNSIVRPIVLRGVSDQWDKIDDAISSDNAYEAVEIVYQLTKLRMYPDALFPLNPEGSEQLIRCMEILDPDHILNFMSNSGVVSYVVNMGYINDIVAPKVIELIKSVGGNVMYTLDNFVPREDYVTDTFRVFIDHCITDTETALSKYAQYTEKYCKFHDGRKLDIIDVEDILDDFDSVYSGLINEFERIYGEVSNFIPQTTGTGQMNSMIDPNMEQMAATTEYPAEVSAEMEGVTNDEAPFPGESITISKSTERTEVSIHSGGNGDENPAGDTRSTNEVSNSDGTSAGSVQSGVIKDGAVRGNISGGCTTNLGDVLKNALKDEEKEEKSGNTGRVYVAEAGSKDSEEGSVSVLSGGSADKREQKEKEEKSGDMVISVTTCG